MKITATILLVFVSILAIASATYSTSNFYGYPYSYPSGIYVIDQFPSISMNFNNTQGKITITGCNTWRCYYNIYTYSPTMFYFYLSSTPCRKLTNLTCPVNIDTIALDGLFLSWYFVRIGTSYQVRKGGLLYTLRKT